MKVIFFDLTGRKIQLFENTPASEYLYCVSRALVEPSEISPHHFIAEMESLPHTQKFLELRYDVRKKLLSLNGKNLISYIQQIEFPGIFFMQCIDNNKISDYSSAHPTTHVLFDGNISSSTPLLFTDPREVVFNRQASPEPNNDQPYWRERNQLG